MNGRHVLAQMLAFGAAPYVLPSQVLTHADKDHILFAPFTHGGTDDVTACAIGPALEVDLGRNVTVDNRPDFDCVIGITLVSRVEPDVSTPLIAPSGTPAVVANDITAELRKTPVEGGVKSSLLTVDGVAMGSTPSNLLPSTLRMYLIRLRSIAMSAPAYYRCQYGRPVRGWHMRHVYQPVPTKRSCGVLQWRAH